MSWVWSLPLSPGGWKCSDSQFLLQYPSFLGACFSPIILLNFAFVHVRCLQWLLNKQINAIVFDSYGLDSASQTSSKVVYGRESYVSHPLFLAVFCCISNFSFLFFFFSILFFYFIFLFIHLAFIFFTPSPSQRMPSFCHLLLKRFALKVHSYTPIWKVTKSKPERCSVRSTAALLPQEN